MISYLISVFILFEKNTFSFKIEKNSMLENNSPEKTNEKKEDKVLIERFTILMRKGCSFFILRFKT